MATSTVENYLKAILHLEEGPDSSPSVGAIAEELKVTPGTVSVMMRHLAEANLVSYVPRRSIELLPEGRRQALQIVRRHRLIETFLVQVMKLDWSEVHEEAEVLEHTISDRLLARIDEMLGHPEEDPHGDPIPNEAGEFPTPPETLSLSKLDEGSFRVIRVDDSSPDFLAWLKAHSLLPGKEFQLRTRDRIAGLLEVIPSDGSASVTVGETAAAQILVEAI